MIPKGAAQSSGRILPTLVVRIRTRLLLAAVRFIWLELRRRFSICFICTPAVAWTPSSTSEGIWTEPIKRRGLLRRGGLGRAASSFIGILAAWRRTNGSCCCCCCLGCSPGWTLVRAGGVLCAAAIWTPAGLVYRDDPSPPLAPPPPHPTPILTLLSLSKPRGNQRSLVNKQGHKGHSRIKFNRPRRERNKKK